MSLLFQADFPVTASTPKIQKSPPGYKPHPSNNPSIMLPQRKLIARSITPGDPLITFILAGRTTLSEHSPSSKIHVPYSTAHRSLYLRSLLPLPRTPPFTPIPTIHLSSIHPTAFTLYTSYLSSGHIPTSSFLHHSSLQLRECLDLIYAHILGTLFRDAAFQDCVLETLARVLDPVQTPDLDVLEVLFLERGVSGVLSAFVIEGMFRQDRWILGLLRGVERGSCECLVSEAEGWWDRDGLGDVRVYEEEDGLGERRRETEMPWSADDDIKLRDMAAFYLRRKDIGSSKTSRGVQCSSKHYPQRSYSRAHHISNSYTCTPSPGYPKILDPPIVLFAATTPRLDKPLPEPPSPGLLTENSSEESTADAPLQRTSVADREDDDGCDEDNDEDTHLTISAACMYPPTSPFPTPRTSPSRALSFVPLLKTTTRHPSFTEIQSRPSAQYSSSSHSAPPLPTGLSCSTASPTPPLLRISRKPAPPRGVDWLEQSERLYALQGTQGFGLRKQGGVGGKKKGSSLLR